MDIRVALEAPFGCPLGPIGFIRAPYTLVLIFLEAERVFSLVLFRQKHKQIKVVWLQFDEKSKVRKVVLVLCCHTSRLFAKVLLAFFV